MLNMAVTTEYKDKHGKLIEAGMTLKHLTGAIEKVYETTDGDLGFNASNENFSGFDPMLRELYPLYQFDMKDWEIVEEDSKS
jgi:hypothetical protein